MYSYKQLKMSFWRKRMQLSAQNIRLYWRGVAGIVILSLSMGFLIEWGGFGKVWNKVQDSEERKVFEISSDEIQANGFIRNAEGQYVSIVENATLDISLGGRFVNFLEFHVDEDSYLPIEVDIFNEKEGMAMHVPNGLREFIQKKKKPVSDFFVYPIHAKSDHLMIQVQGIGVTLLDMRIDNRYHFNQYRFTFFVGSIFLISFFLLYWRKVGENPEVGFLAVALVCGTVLSFVGPGYTYTWDEKIHYQRAEKIAFSVYKMDFRPGSTPSRYTLQEEKAVNIYVNSQYKQPKKNPKNNEFWYTQIGYLPSAVALTIGEILPVSHTLVFKFGRWFNMFIFSLIVFFAMRKIRSGKVIMAVVALFPTSIFLASNYDYDWWVTAFTLLGLAYLFSALQQPEKKITIREIVIMIGAFIAGLGPKAIYFPLMFLMFLLKRKKFVSVGQYKKFLLAVSLSIAFVAGSFLVPFVFDGPGKGDGRGGEAVNSAEQVRFILENPVAYSKILLNFMGQYVSPNNAVGYTTFFAYLGSFSGTYFILGLLLCLTILDRSNLDEVALTIGSRVWIFSMIFISVALVCTALYVAFTPVRSETISGVQPRYLIPLIFPFFYILGGMRIGWLNKKRKEVLALLTFISLAGIFLWGVWTNVLTLY